MEADALADLLSPLSPILRHCLAVAPLPHAGVALDLACGPGHKTPLLAEACGPDVRLIGIDRDATAIRAATTDQRPYRHDISCPDQRPYRHDISCPDREPRTGRQKSAFVGIVGDALALPLREGCCDAAFCIAALSLFAD